MRMSRAICPVRSGRFRRADHSGPRLILQAGERHTDSRAAALAILDQKVTAVIFHDFLDDSEPQTGPFFARRYIRLRQSVLQLPRQAGAVVLDRNLDLPVICLPQQHPDLPCLLARRAVLGQRIGRVLQQIGQGLADLAPVA